MNRTLARIATCLCTLIVCNACSDKAATPINTKATVINTNHLLQCPPAKQIAREMVVQINNARSKSRTCGDERYKPAPSIAWNDKLKNAALNHSKNMANEGFFSHTAPDGSDPSERVRAAGYVWKNVGENISAGHESVQEVVSSWLNSPAHCTNIMSPQFREIGAACARNSASRYGTYWTLVFATSARPTK